jgi:mercuric ion transport protein
MTDLPRDADRGVEALRVERSGEGKAGLLAAGGLFGALAASTCCLLPLVLFSLGVGGAWIANLTALAPYQPVFLGLTLACLLAGFWLVYRRPKAACAEGEACARPMPRRIVRIALWLATGLVAAALVVPPAASWLLA